MSVIEVAVPDIGDFADVPVIEVLVAPGDTVAPEDSLVTLESDKATMDVPSPAAGTVSEIRVKVGDKVSQGSVVLTMEAAEAASSADAQQSPPIEEAPAPTPAKAEEPAAPSPAAPATGGPGSHVLVIGSGPGGYTAAFRAADLGLKVTLVERYPILGGVCLNVGCIPSKALLHAARVVAETEEMAEHGVSFSAPKVDLPKLIAWKQDVVDKLTGGLAGLAKQRKVEVVTGVAKFTGPNSVAVDAREITFDNCIIAAGSSAVKLPFMPEDPRIIDSTGALSPDDVPGRFLVIGGGIIGLEMATVYHALGATVTVVEMMDQLIPDADADLVRPLYNRIRERYAGVLLGTQVTAVKSSKSGLRVSFSEGKDQTFDRILVAVGRIPNGKALDAEKAGINVDERGFIPVDDQQRTNVPGLYAIGDIVGGPMLAHKATHEAKAAAEVIAAGAGGSHIRFDALTVPSVAFTDPEVAWMGLTESDAKAQGVKYEKATFPWAASGRALGLGRPEGFTKLLFDPETDRLLGAGIVGVGAGDLIAETVLALEAGLNAQDIALAIHPHPTLSETIAFAAEMQDGSITDLLPPRKRKS
ncbi:MAG TPA: dihydrolipoyl dehydrogenase [Solirubrobacteraceae bacterium]|nr:dihydrolipoyl dehydrogenase [Solirubrobacteraceae bacterium]